MKTTSFLIFWPRTWPCRDMDDAPIDESNYAELTSRIDAYIAEFEEHGTDNILVDIDS